MATSVLTAPPESVPDGPRRRRAFWRSPDDQPGHARPALLGIAAVAAVLFAWGIDQAGFHSFYANAARSGSESWKAFIFGSFDPASTITLDKLPGFIWPQALSARIFGFHPWSVALPQAIEGVLAVLVLYKAVRRWAGANAALLACGLFTLTPVIAGLFRTSVEDPAFTLLLICAAEAAQRAAQTGRLRTLLMSGVWVGLAFQTKMLESWAVLPALAVIYLVSAPATLRRRIGHVALAGVVTVAVSASWILLVTVTPAKDRPYVDGTTNNSALSMVVGYNFLNRFSSVGISASDSGSVQGGMFGGGKHGAGFGGGVGTGARAGHNGGGAAGSSSSASSGSASSGSASSGSASSGSGTPSAKAMASAAMALGGGSGGNGWSKMFGTTIASQTGWLYPLAALSLVCGVFWRRRKPRGDRLRAGFLMWGTWLAMFFLAFSAGSVGGHSYYMGVIATPLAALSGVGLVQFWRGYRAGGRRVWALPVAIVSTVAYAVVLSEPYPSFRPWAMPLAIVAGVVSLALLYAARMPRFSGRRIAVAGLVAGLVAVVATPAAWATSVLDGGRGGMAGQMGAVGPAASRGFGGAAAALGGGRREGFGGGEGFGGFGGYGDRSGRSGSGRSGMAGGAGGGFGASSGSLTAQQQQLLDYVSAHADGARYLTATTSWITASPYILATGEEVMPMGGFSGDAPSPSLAQFQQLVSSGQLHYVLLGGVGMGGFGWARGGGSTSPTTAVQNWVRQSCTVVPAAAYGGSTAGTSSAGSTTSGNGTGGAGAFGGFGGFGGGGFGGRGATQQQLYRCGAGG